MYASSVTCTTVIPTCVRSCTEIGGTLLLAQLPASLRVDPLDHSQSDSQASLGMLLEHVVSRMNPAKARSSTCEPSTSRGTESDTAPTTELYAPIGGSGSQARGHPSWGPADR